jgi:ubiquinone/menaquinone biosynthesis C-methylase UbiE
MVQEITVLRGFEMTTPRRSALPRLALAFLLAGTWLTLALLPSTTEAQGTTAPAAVSRYMGREIATTMHYSGANWLVRESRQREEDCKQLLAELDVQPGQVLCDMGCGNGFYAIQLARLTGPEGKVYAVDVQEEMLDMLNRRTRQAKLDNVIPLLGTESDPGLSAGSLDLVLMVDVYHEFSHPEKMLRAIRTSLKPTGRIALVEFRGEDPEVPIKPLHKMSKPQILKEFSANGLKLVEQFDGLPWQHVMFFCRADPLQPKSTRRRERE